MAETMSAILREDPPDLSETNKTVARALEEFQQMSARLPDRTFHFPIRPDSFHSRHRLLYPISFDTRLFQEYKSLVIKQAQGRQNGAKTLMELSRTKFREPRNVVAKQNKR